MFIYQPFLSDNPFHMESVRTFLSINFLHNMPSLITLYHSLQTNSAAHMDLESKYDKMFSATWSKPFSMDYKAIFHLKPFFKPQIWYLGLCLFIQECNSINLQNK